LRAAGRSISRGLAGAVENRHAEPCEALRVGDQRDLGNPSADDRHAEHDARPTAWRPHGTHRSVDERQPRDNVAGLLEAAAPSAGRRSAP